MGSTPNLSHIAAYGAMAELVEAYFNTAGQALKDLQKRGLSIDLDAYQKPGDFLRELVSTSSVALDDSADVAQLFASIKSGLANKYDLPNVQLDAVS